MAFSLLPPSEFPSEQRKRLVCFERLADVQPEASFSPIPTKQARITTWLRPTLASTAAVLNMDANLYIMPDQHHPPSRRVVAEWCGPCVPRTTTPLDEKAAQVFYLNLKEAKKVGAELRLLARMSGLTSNEYSREMLMETHRWMDSLFLSTRELTELGSQRGGDGSAV